MRPRGGRTPARPAGATGRYIGLADQGHPTTSSEARAIEAHEAEERRQVWLDWIEDGLLTSEEAERDEEEIALARDGALDEDYDYDYRDDA